MIVEQALLRLKIHCRYYVQVEQDKKKEGEQWDEETAVAVKGGSTAGEFMCGYLLERKFSDGANYIKRSLQPCARVPLALVFVVQIGVVYS